jgi:hypothetical protein
MPDTQCFFSVARYVADSRRNEGRNIGVLVIAPEQGYAGARFLLSRSNVQKGTKRFRMLEALLRSYEIEMPGEATPLFATLPGGWDRDRLSQLHQECTNLIQFTEPAPAYEEPDSLIERLYRERVQSKMGGRGRGAPWTSSRTADAFRTVFARYNKEDAIDDSGEIPLSDGTYNFGLAVKNGRPLFVVETVSLKLQNLRRVEHDAAWFAYVWPHVADETQAKGLLFAEREPRNVEAERCFNRIRGWAEAVKIEVHEDPAKEAKELAESIVGAVPSPSSVH